MSSDRYYIFILQLFNNVVTTLQINHNIYFYYLTRIS